MAKTKMRDMVVLLPGITGSVLVDDKGKEVWNASGQAAWSYIRSLGKSLEQLVVAAHSAGSDADPGVLRPAGLVSGVHGVFGLGRIDGYRQLAAMILQNFEVHAPGDDPKAPANFFELAYDWRLSNRTSARALKSLLDERLPIWRRTPQGGQGAKFILIAHSMGGLVSRYYLEKLGGWEHCRALVTFGTPYRGSTDAVGYLANGYKKAFLDFTSAMRSMPSVYELLPIWRMVQHENDFKRVAESEGIPHIDPARAQDALAFHREIEEAVEQHKHVPEYRDNRYHIIPVVGVSQPTLQSASFDGESLTTSRSMPAWIDGPLEGGDGTVPRVSATPIELSNDYLETFFAERHGSLQTNSYVLDDLRERLKQMQSTGLGEVRACFAPPLQIRNQLSLDLDPLYLPGEPVRLRATLLGEADFADKLKARIQATEGNGAVPAGMQEAQEYDFHDGPAGPELVVEGLTPGSYRVRVKSAKGGPRAATPVSDVFEVAE